MRQIISPLDGIRSPFGARSGFSPVRLFGLNEPGIWLDPSDVANLDWRRNLLTYSEQFDNAAWLKDNASIVANPAIAPDGTATADQLVENTATGLHDIYTLPATQPVGTFTYSLYVKASGRTKFRLQQTSVTAYGVLFDLVALTATSVVGGAVGSITNVGSGWYRCSLTYTTVASFAPTLTLFLANDAGSISYTGDNASGVIIWGAQLELGSVATDYQRISDVNTEVLERFPKTTMFQDRAGSTAVTTPGQSVGLRLDKSKGLVLGSELVTNGTFDANVNGWTNLTPTGSSFSWNAGKWMDLVFTTGLPTISTSFPTTIGKSYVATASKLGTPSVINIGSSAGGTNLFNQANSSSDLQAIFTATTTTTHLSVARISAGTSSIDNISVKELPGNHAVANSDAARGIYGIEPLGGRRNLLTFTEQFDNAAWPKSNVTVTANVATAPDGTTTAERFTADAATANHRVISTAATLASGLNCVHSVYLKAGTHSFMQIHDGASASYFANFNVSTGVVGTATGCTAAMTDVGNGWYRCSIAMTLNGANPVLCVGMVTSNTAARNESWTAVGTETVLVWGAQLETGSTATAYQRVTDQYNVTEAGKQTLHYVQYDGSDDGYVTPTISPESALVVSGSELVTNGDFASGASWTTETGWSIGSGIATKIASAANANLTQTVAIVAGRPYRVTYTLTHTAGGFQIILGGAASSVKLASGSYTDIIVAGSSNQLVSAFGNAAFAGTIDNISVREMSGAADKVQVFAGVRKLSDAATGVVIEHSVTLNSNAGTFFLLAPNTTASTNAIFASKGSLPTFGSGSAVDIGAAPVTRVLSGIGDIAADTSILRMNGTQVATSATDQGTGNFLAYPLYIGRRGGTTLPFNGRDYGICVRFGANLDASTIAATESWLNQKTGAF